TASGLHGGRDQRRSFCRSSCGQKTRSSLIESQLTDLSVIPFDAELSIGAANAVNTCLCIQPHEQVTIITDLASREIAASIVDQVAKTRAPYRTFVLEEVAQRPLEQMPAEILQELEGSHVTIFPLQVHTNHFTSP